MARSKETCVIILDVSPSIHPYLKHVAKVASTMVQRKLILSKFDEVGVLVCGVKDGVNELHGELGGYENVSVLRAIQVIDDDVLDLLQKLPYGSEPGDYLDAIVVGMDLLIKKCGPGKKGNKQIFLITNGESLVKESSEDESKEEQSDKIAAQIVEQGMKLNAVMVKFIKGKYKSKARIENEQLLRRFTMYPGVELSLANSPASLLGAIKLRNVTPVTLYRGDMELTPNMKVKVWVYKKISEERIPTLKKYSDKAPYGAPHVTHEVKMDIEYKSVEDPDRSVPPEQRLKAYRYGPQLVPVSKEVEDALKLKTEKGIKLIGFTDASNVLRHHYMKESNIFIPDPGHVKSIVAISALVRAMKELKKVAIVRCVWRQGQANVVLGVLTPHVSTDSSADSFYFNVLPFMEDAREFPFTSFDSRPASMQPNTLQQDAADDVVKMFDLSSLNDEEALQPEKTLNPILQRWYAFLLSKYRDPEAELPQLDDTLQPIVQPLPELLSENEYILKRLNSLFTLKINEQKDKKSRQFWREKEEEKNDEVYVMETDTGEGQLSFDSLTAKKVSEVGSIQPVQDFEAMLARRDGDEWVLKAVQEMKKIINDLLESSYKGNTYDKALACLVALRVGCVQHEEPLEFNQFLRELANKCRGRRLNDFWEHIVDKRLSLINKNEAADSDASEEEAMAFLCGNTVEDNTPEAPHEDEIDEMEALLGEAV